MTLDQYYSVEEFAKILKVNPQSIRRAIRMGRIQALRVMPGKKAPYRIAATELDRMAVMSYEETIKNIKSLFANGEKNG